MADHKHPLQHILKRWEKASTMRKWLNEKKSKLSNKFTEKI